MYPRKAVAAASVVVALGLAGCGATATDKPISAAGLAVVGPRVGPLGSTLALVGEGTAAQVALLKVIDPAEGASSAWVPNAGYRFVGIMVRLKNTGVETISDNSDSDTTLTGTDGEVYSAATAEVRLDSAGGETILNSFDDHSALPGTDQETFSAAAAELAGCPNFVGAQIMLAPRDASIGCVPFELPKGVKVAQIRFALEVGIEGIVGEWTVAQRYR